LLGLPTDWDRCLRAGNYPATTRYNYLLAAVQLGRYLAEYSPDPDADAAADDPADADNVVRPGHAACSYSCRMPPRRSRRRTARFVILVESVIG
jgi:hypothetical protein